MPTPNPRREALHLARFKAQPGSWPIEGTNFRLMVERLAQGTLHVSMFEGQERVNIGVMTMASKLVSSATGQEKDTIGLGDWIQIRDPVPGEDLHFEWRYPPENTGS